MQPGSSSLTRGSRGEPPPATAIELVAYCTEEPPYFRTPGMGSYQHAKRLKRAEFGRIVGHASGFDGGVSQ